MIMQTSSSATFCYWEVILVYKVFGFMMGMAKEIDQNLRIQRAWRSAIGPISFDKKQGFDDQTINPLATAGQKQKRHQDQKC